MKTLNALQLQAKLLSGLRPSKYKCYNLLIAKNTGFDNPANLCDVGADFQALFGSDYRVPASSGFIGVDGSLSIKFNKLSNDAIYWDISIMGKVWAFNRGDLIIDKIYFQNASYTEDIAALVTVWSDKYAELNGIS